MSNAAAKPILVFSHLRWNFVYQRPQQILSRLARTRPIHFVEEPKVSPGCVPHWEHETPEPSVNVWRPVMDVDDVSFGQLHRRTLQPMLEKLAREHKLHDCIAWFYTPMAVHLAEIVRPSLVVYDCMDELSAFLNAPREMIDRENLLLKQADFVFTGGPSLYRAKKDRHRNVHCFPSSVDAAHFAKARHSAEEPVQQTSLKKPRIGFFGVVDERMDLEILETLAASKPKWEVVIVGPVVKIDPAKLPRHSNIHYFGQQGYAHLPGFIKGWDLCIMPFARNEATRFISPTKTLEYMAAEKMIVSTPITDVAEPYGEIVFLGNSPKRFVQACGEALGLDESQRRKRITAMREVLARTSWDHTVEAMNRLIEAALPPAGPTNSTSLTAHKRHAGARSRAVSRSSSSNGHASNQADHVPVAIIGAGPTGLSAAYHLGPDALVLEKNDRIGGWCRSVEDGGFTFDMAGHIMFSKDQYVHELYQKLLGDNVHWQDREAWVYSKGVYTRYPFQGCLYGLPPEVITECIVGAVEARFGSLQATAELEDAVSKAASKHHHRAASNGHAANGNGHGNGNGNGFVIRSAHSSGKSRMNGNGRSPGRQQRCDSFDVKDCCGDGILEAETSTEFNGHQAGETSEPRNFEEFIYKIWGRGIAKHFAIPYNEKLWAVPLTEMETSWLGGRVPMPDIEEMIRYALTPAAKPMGPNARFGYPLRGGFQALMDGFLPFVKDQLRLNSAVLEISPSQRLITLKTGEQISFDHLISTMPLPLLIRAMGEEAPRHVRRAAAGLRHVSVRCVNLGIGREKINSMHWIYFPEDTVFHRIFVQGNASPHCNPPGGFGITCEITYSPTKPLPCDGEELIQRCIDDCKRIGFIREDDPIWVANQVDMPMAYVVYDHARPKNVQIIRDWLAKHDITLAGRYSEWEYFNSDHAFMTGKHAAEAVKAKLSAPARVPAKI